MCKYKLKGRSKPGYGCEKSPWEQSEEGYCIFHEPGNNKDIELFNTELQKEKLDKQDYEFAGFVFPGNTPYFKDHKFESDVNFTEAVFLGATTDFSWARFSGATTDFSRVKFLGEEIFFNWAKFSGKETSFHGARFSGVLTSFSAAKFSSCTTYFSAAKFSGDMTDFNLAEFSGDKTYFNRAEFSGRSISFLGAEFSGDKTDLSSVNLRGVAFTGADLGGANLRGADLREAILVEANLENANVSDVKYNRWGKYRGIRVATCYGSPLFKRFAQDHDFIEELWRTRRGKLIYGIWEVFADCGRPPGILLWSGWSILFAFLFALIYCYHLGPLAFNFGSSIPPNFKTFLYYSVVTFTTLGFGDVTPETNYASYFVMAEVFLGYVMLGGLISIFATMLARRS